MFVLLGLTEEGREEGRMARKTVQVKRMRRLTRMPASAIVSVDVDVDVLGLRGLETFAEPTLGVDGRAMYRLLEESLRVRPSAVMPPMTRLRSCRKFSKRNGVRKPREPREKDNTGGTIRWKSHDVKSTVPSPPSVNTRSKRSGFVQQRSGVQ